MIAGAATRIGRTTPGELAGVLSCVRSWPGVRRAQLVARHADAARESPAESVSFAAFIEPCLPLPECNPWLLTANGDHVRPDFLW